MDEQQFKISVTIGYGETFTFVQPCVTGINRRPWKIEDIAKDEQLIKILFESAFSEACEIAIESYKDRYGNATQA